ASPEQLRGEHAAVDARSDVYSLGATLYHALTLRPMQLRSASDAIRFFERGLSLPPLRRNNPQLPRDLDTIVAKAIDPDPAARYQSAGEFADDLERLLSLQPIKARHAGPVARAWKAARRNRRVIAAAASAAVLTLVLVGAGVMRWAVLPHWTQQAVRNARLALLDQNQGAALWVLAFHEQAVPDAAAHRAALDRALKNYDVAHRCSPFDKELTTERHVVGLARKLLAGQPTPFPPNELPQHLPRFNAYVAAKAAGGPRPWPAGIPASVFELGTEHESNESRDLRSLGLLAFLTDDMSTALDAWRRYDAFDAPDPLVNAAFGMLYLVTDKPELAYPRLQSANEELPDVGFLTVYLADAARGCNDFDRARRLLRRAADMSQHDIAGGLDRVRADLEADSGNVALAEQLYGQLIARGGNTVAPIHYARWLAGRGETERSLCAYVEGLKAGFGPGRIRGEFTELTEGWWDKLGAAEQARALEDGCVSPRCISELRKAYAESILGLGREPSAFVAP
ncbi:MAG: hypothetical protein H7210_07915, partial [Pyrinomonadaceae bacterium]|nr:hypothetical protein [Phycisphaerales bacterium]